MPLVQLPLEMVPKLVVARALQVEELLITCALQVEELLITCALQVEELVKARVMQVGIVQPSQGIVPETTHIHPTCPAGVRGWAESQVLCYNVHNVQVGARKAKLVVV